MSGFRIGSRLAVLLLLAAISASCISHRRQMAVYRPVRTFPIAPLQAAASLPTAKLPPSPPPASPQEPRPWGTVNNPILASYSTTGRVIREEPSVPNGAMVTDGSTGGYGDVFPNGGGSPTGPANYDVFTGGSVRVRGYYRKDGTYVRPHTRSAPDGVRSNNRRR